MRETYFLDSWFKVHLSPKCFTPSNKFCYHLEHFITKSFWFGLIPDFLCAVEVRKSGENRHHFGSGSSSQGMGLVNLWRQIKNSHSCAISIGDTMYISLELSKMYWKLSTVRIAPRSSTQRNESQDISLHNTAFFDDEWPEAKRRNEWILQSNSEQSSSLPSTRYYARCISSKDLLSQKKVSNQTRAFCVVPMIQRPINHRIPCHINYFLWSPRYAVRRKLLPLQIIQVGYTVSAE